MTQPAASSSSAAASSSLSLPTLVDLLAAEMVYLYASTEQQLLHNLAAQVDQRNQTLLLAAQPIGLFMSSCHSRHTATAGSVVARNSSLRMTEGKVVLLSESVMIRVS